MSEKIVFRAKSDREANGRKPIAGDLRYTLSFPLDDGRTLEVQLGPDDMRNVRNVVLQEMIEDEKAGGN